MCAVPPKTEVSYDGAGAADDDIHGNGVGVKAMRLQGNRSVKEWYLSA